MIVVLTVFWATQNPSVAQRGGAGSRPPELQKSTLERDVTTYDVQGATPSEVWASIRQGGPKNKSSDRRFAGYAQWWINWRVTTAEVGGTCRVEQAFVSTRILITLPNWVNKTTADPGLQKSWDDFLRALTVHEEGHASLAIEQANDIERGLKALPAAATCDEVVAAARAHFDTAFAALNDAQAAYDKSTDHGRTQGAVFPARIPLKPGGGTDRK